MEKKEFIDEFMDRIYLIGSKDNGKYILTLTQAEQVASELYDTCFEKNCNCKCDGCGKMYYESDIKMMFGEFNVCDDCKNNPKVEFE